MDIDGGEGARERQGEGESVVAGMMMNYFKQTKRRCAVMQQRFSAEWEGQGLRTLVQYGEQEAVVV